MIKLSLEEKLYIVAVLGDIPERRRKALFKRSKFPAQAGPGIMAAGFEYTRGGRLRHLHPSLEAHTKGERK